MFTEDLRGYDVCRRSCTAWITRRSENGWKPLNQDHLEGHDQEEREARNMAAYYRMRSRQQLGSYLR